MGEGGRNYGEKGEFAVGSPNSVPVEPLKKSIRIKTGKGPCLDVPPDAARKLGLEPGAELEVIVEGGRVEVRPNIHSLSRVYVEPTSRCNLTCATCIRNTWKEPLGDMDMAVFDRLTAQLKQFPHIESVMFGGFGEPTAHPDILRMIGAVKRLGLRTEMVTNGTRLDDAMLAGLMASGLDMLWVSFDGTSEACFEGIREGADYGRVVASLRRLQPPRGQSRGRLRKLVPGLRRLSVGPGSHPVPVMSVPSVCPHNSGLRTGESNRLISTPVCE